MKLKLSLAIKVDEMDDLWIKQTDKMSILIPSWNQINVEVGGWLPNVHPIAHWTVQQIVQQTIHLKVNWS